MTVHYEFKLERQARSLFQLSSQNRDDGFNYQEQGHGVEFEGPDHGI